MLRFAPDPPGSDGMGTLSVFRTPSNFANGNTRDRQGRLVTCEHGTRRVTRTEADGTITIIVDSYYQAAEIVSAAGRCSCCWPNSLADFPNCQAAI